MRGVMFGENHSLAIRLRRTFTKALIENNDNFFFRSVKQNAAIDYTPSAAERVFGPHKEQQLKSPPADNDVHMNSVGSKLIITRNWLKPILT